MKSLLVFKRKVLDSSHVAALDCPRLSETLSDQVAVVIKFEVHVSNIDHNQSLVVHELS